MAARQGSGEVNLAIQRFRHAVTGRWAVSIRTYLAWVFPFGFLTAIEREQQFHNISVSEAAGIVLGGELACGLYLFIVQALLIGDRRVRQQPLWKVIFVWISAGLVRGFFIACNANWGSGFDYNLAQRVPTAAIYTASALAIVAYYFGVIDRKRLEARALRSLENVLVQEQSGLGEMQKHQRQRRQEVLHSQLLPQVNALRIGIEKLLSRSSNETIFDSRSLNLLYEQSREISSEINIQLKSPEAESVATLSDRGEERAPSYWSRMWPKVVSIRLTFLLLVCGSFSGQFERNGLEGALAGFVGALVVVIYLYPISHSLKKTTLSRPILYTLAYAGSFGVQSLITLLQPSIGLHLSDPYQPWYSGIKTMYGVYIASVIATLITSAQESFSVLSKTGSNLRDKIDHLTEENFSLERTIESSQYGMLQGKIAGVTMALHLMNSMTSISQERRSDLLYVANALLNESLREIENLQVGSQ